MDDRIKTFRIDDEILDGVSGGAEIAYGMDDDPLYKKFNSFWQDNKGKSSGSGMDSRAEFMNAFKQWVKDGVPENISGWYRSFSGGKNG